MKKTYKKIKEEIYSNFTIIFTKHLFKKITVARLIKNEVIMKTLF